MKKIKSIRNNLSILIVILILVFLFTGCANTSKQEKSGYVTVTIDASSVDEGILLSDYSVSISEATNAFDATFIACRENEILMSSRGLSGTRYIEGIADLYEFDYGPASGWVFYVNEISSTKSSGVYELNEGDEIRWEYIIEQ